MENIVFGLCFLFAYILFYSLFPICFLFVQMGSIILYPIQFLYCKILDKTYLYPYSTSSNTLKIIAIETHLNHINYSDNYEILSTDFTISIFNNEHIEVKSHSLYFSQNLQKRKRKGTIYLIHGANSGPICWLHIIQPLVEANYDVHLLSLPCFGQTNVSQYNKLMKLPAKQLLKFICDYIYAYKIKYNENNNPIIVGHSFGGYISSAFACKYPEHCKTFIMINAVGIFPILGHQSNLWAFIFKFGFPNKHFRYFGQRWNTIFAYLFEMTGTTDYCLFWNILSLTCNENYGDLIISKFIYYNGCNSYWKHSNFINLVSEQIPPIGIIWGENDTIVPVEIPRFLTQEFGIKKDDEHQLLYCIPDCWHNPVSKKLSNIVLDIIQKPFYLKKVPKNSTLYNDLHTIMSSSCSTLSPSSTVKKRDNEFSLIKKLCSTIEE